MVTPLEIMHSAQAAGGRMEEHFSCFICLQGISKAKLLPCCGKAACHGCLNVLGGHEAFVLTVVGVVPTTRGVVPGDPTSDVSSLPSRHLRF